MPFIFIGLAVIVLVLLAVNVSVVPQSKVFMIERLGKFKTQWHAGIHVKLPFVDRVSKKISLKEQVMDFPPQSVITKDNVTINIDSVVFYLVEEPYLYTYKIANPIIALQNLSATTLRNIIGEMELDQTLTSRDEINAKLRAILDEATEKWGIDVTRVEIQNIVPPSQIQEVMTKQMRAERERRQIVLEAQAHQESVVSRAEGDKKAKILSAEADRDAKIAVAEGRARSIKMVYAAEARGLQALKEAGVDDAVLRLRGLDALKSVADGRSTKIFLPSDIGAAISSLGVGAELAKSEPPAAASGASEPLEIHE